MHRTRRTAAASVLLASTCGLLAFAAADSAYAQVEEEPTTTIEETTTTVEETTTTLPEVTTTTEAPTTTTTLPPVVLTEAPSITTLVARPSALTVSWVEQEDLTDGPIRVYQVIALENDVIKSQQVVAGDIRSVSLSGLANGHEYDVVVLPYTDAGAGNMSDSEEGTPSRDGSAVHEATVARDVAATTGKGFANVTWKAPVTDGGSAIAGYALITSEKVSGAFHSWRNLGADLRQASVPNLLDNKAYDVVVVPYTSLGLGDVAPAVSVTPSGTSTVLPLAPQSTWVSAVASGDNASVRWGPAAERGEALVAWHVIVMQDGEMIAWTVVAPGAPRQALIPIDEDNGPASVYVFAQSSSGFGPGAGPLTVTPPAPVT
jgi:hypothetical protein